MFATLSRGPEGVDAINIFGVPRVVSRCLASFRVVDSTVSAAQLDF
jgi:hypothetical protein